MQGQAWFASLQRKEGSVVYCLELQTSYKQKEVIICVGCFLRITRYVSQIGTTQGVIST